MKRVIMYVFAGRQANMELQLPFIRCILDEHPEVEYHVWNLTRTKSDDTYVRGIKGDRITVRNEYKDEGWNSVWRHYATSKYRGSTFVKIDDDVVFIQTGRFGKFLEAVRAYPHTIMSANVINNGACTRLEPSLYKLFELLKIPLLDVHESNEYAIIAHSFFHRRSKSLLGQPIEIIATRDWLSINLIGYSWEVGGQIAAMLDKPHPASVAGRSFDRSSRLGDEGACNVLPRAIMRGFIAGHLTFGPQHCKPEQERKWRSKYAQIGQAYLEADHPVNEEPLPEMLAGVAAQSGWRARHAISAGDNDPRVGRYEP